MSDFKPRNLLLVAALALALTLSAVIFVRSRPAIRPEEVVQALPKGVDVSLQEIDYTHLEAGRPRWRLVAGQVARQAGSGLIGVSTPRVSFYDEAGEPAGSLQAAEGDVSEDYRKISLRGDVVLENPDYTIRTASLDFDQDARMATSSAQVRLEGAGVSLEGTGLEFDMQHRRLRLNAKVSGRIDPDRGK